jgi:hypothetical protein
VSPAAKEILGVITEAGFAALSELMREGGGGKAAAYAAARSVILRAEAEEADRDGQTKFPNFTPGE